MSELAIGLFGFLWLLMVLGLIGGLIFLATAIRSGEWDHEDEFCRCGHDYYDHVHHLSHHPCGALMCACETYKKEPRP